MRCKECECKPLARGLKKIKCIKCKKNALNSASSTIEICFECAQTLHICDQCGKPLDKVVELNYEAMWKELKSNIHMIGFSTRSEIINYMNKMDGTKI